MAAWAGGGPLATADCSEAFAIAGRTVPKAGIGSWPVFAGERVQSQNASVLLSLRDGSRVLLEKNSAAVLATSGGKTTLRVTKGAVSYRLSSSASLSLDLVEKGITNVIPTTGVVTADGLTAQTVGYFALTSPSATAAGSMPIVLNFTSVPSGVSVVPGPPPESSYRGAP
jgi:hypothetical protein